MYAAYPLFALLANLRDVIIGRLDMLRFQTAFASFKCILLVCFECCMNSFQQFIVGVKSCTLPLGGKRPYILGQDWNLRKKSILRDRFVVWIVCWVCNRSVTIGNRFQNTGYAYRRLVALCHTRFLAVFRVFSGFALLENV